LWNYLALSVSPVLAQGRGVGGGVGVGVGGGGGAGIGAGMGAGANAGAGMSGGMRGGADTGANMGGSSGVNGNFGGQSNADISAQGRANGNGPDATDRDFGTNRANDRRAGASNNTNAEVNAASELGKLNAVHASANAREHANANSTVGSIATYESQMKTALAISNTTQRNAAIVSARQQLAEDSNKQLTPSAVASIDSSLSIQGASPQLGTTR
jgi:hypothetical protein